MMIKGNHQGRTPIDVLCSALTRLTMQLYASFWHSTRTAGQVL